MTPQERIRLARRGSGLSQADLAKAVGVQRSAVSHWEAPRGKHPSTAHLREIAQTTNVQFEWLATGRGSMNLSREDQLDSVAAAEAVLVEDAQELRLIEAWRTAPLRARVAMLEIFETLAGQRTGRVRG